MYRAEADVLLTSPAVSLDILEKAIFTLHTEEVTAALKIPFRHQPARVQSGKAWRLSPHILKAPQELRNQAPPMIFTTTARSRLRLTRDVPAPFTHYLSNQSHFSSLTPSGGATFSTQLVTATFLLSSR